MRSLTARLGLFMGVAAAVIVGIAGVLITFERWQEQNGGLTRRVELAAFEAQEDPEQYQWNETGGFIVVFDESGEVTYRTDVTDLDANILEDIWTKTTEENLVVTSNYADAGTNVVVSGVQCADPNQCDTVVVGAAEQGFSSFFVARSGWVVGSVLALGALVVVSVRWIVRRSLRPVDEMRAELAAITATDLDQRVSTARDTEFERLANTMNATVDRLAAALSANERFVADAAHELRSPITGVRAALELEAQSQPGSLVADCLPELERAGYLIDDLLLLARSQGVAPSVVEVDLDDLVRQELALMRTRFPGVTVLAELQPARVSGDPDSLRRVVANLLENAGRHGGSRVIITVAGGPMSSLVVDDDGPGIPVDERERIFERFARLDESRARQTGGSGLGLAIVGEIVAAHGGRVTVETSPLGGARFSVSGLRSGDVAPPRRRPLSGSYSDAEP